MSNNEQWTRRVLLSRRCEKRGTSIVVPIDALCGSWVGEDDDGPLSAKKAIDSITRSVSYYKYWMGGRYA